MFKCHFFIQSCQVMSQSATSNATTLCLCSEIMAAQTFLESRVSKDSTTITRVDKSKRDSGVPLPVKIQIRWVITKPLSSKSQSVLNWVEAVLVPVLYSIFWALCDRKCSRPVSLLQTASLSLSVRVLNSNVLTQGDILSKQTNNQKIMTNTPHPAKAVREKGKRQKWQRWDIRKMEVSLQAGRGGRQRKTFLHLHPGWSAPGLSL